MYYMNAFTRLTLEIIAGDMNARLGNQPVSGILGTNGEFVINFNSRIQVKVFCIVPYNVAVGYHHFRGPSCYHLQSEVNGTGKKCVCVCVCVCV